MRKLALLLALMASALAWSQPWEDAPRGPGDDFSGFGWLLIVAAGFLVGYVLAKIRVLRESNASWFANGAALFVAALAAFFADGPSPADWRTIAGKVAIFAIVWVVVGLVFTVGLAWGFEKGSKNK